MAQKDPPLNPAFDIIQLCGGPDKVAEIVNRHVSRVHRWTYPEGERFGTGGRIPDRPARLLLEWAEAHGKNDIITPDMFMAKPSPAQEAANG